MEPYKFNKLNNNFSLWYHNPSNNGWELKDYIKLIEFNSVEEYWYYNGFIDDKLICFGMLFLMKDDIKPLWEDEHNINGGYISIKLNREQMLEKWKLLLNYFVSGNLTENINGISITPKKNFNIIKIWFKDEVDVNTYKFNTELDINENTFLFRNHKNNIQKMTN